MYIQIKKRYDVVQQMTTQITHAEPCKQVQKEEWINCILTDITQNPKVTNNELAAKYQVPRNRISHYRNIIRKRQRTTNFEIVNKIDSILEDILLEMEPRDLIAYRRAVYGEITVTQNNQTNIKIDLSTQVNELIKISREPICKSNESQP